jgi:5-methylcytosine-specific restriction endonuclease McrA
MGKKIKDDSLIQDLRSVSAFFGQRTLSVSEYLKHGKYSRKPFLNRWHTWNNAIRFAGLLPNLPPNEKIKSGYKRGKISSRQYLFILKRDHYRCVICGANPASDNGKTILHIDHIIPVSKGGSSDNSNLWTLCATCNYNKLDKIESDIILLAKEYFDNLD